MSGESACRQRKMLSMTRALGSGFLLVIAFMLGVLAEQHNHRADQALEARANEYVRITKAREGRKRTERKEERVIP